MRSLTFSQKLTVGGSVKLNLFLVLWKGNKFRFTELSESLTPILWDFFTFYIVVSEKKRKPFEKYVRNFQSIIFWLNDQ